MNNLIHYDFVDDDCDDGHDDSVMTFSCVHVSCVHIDDVSCSLG